MTTISDMNIVVQQSSGTKNVQNVRHATQEHSHLAATQQKDKDIEQRTTIQQSEDAERTKLDKDRPDERKKKRHSKTRRGIRASETSMPKSKPSGKILDTVA
jgi:hypothetical protein